MHVLDSLTWTGIFRAWWFDPAVSSLCFTGFINLYWYYECKHGLTTFQDSSWNKGQFQSLWKSTTSRPDVMSGLVYWIGILLWKIIVLPPSNMWDGIPTKSIETAYLMAEVIAGIVFYDFIFFFIHWAMHEVPSLRWIHRQHHSSTRHGEQKQLYCNDVLRHSFLDGMLQVLVNILVQRSTPWGSTKSRMARTIHNVVVTWMLTESHTASPEPYIWRHWFIGVREHIDHHLPRRVGNDDNDDDKVHRQLRYQQFFGYLDNLRLEFERIGLEHTNKQGEKEARTKNRILSVKRVPASSTHFDKPIDMSVGSKQDWCEKKDFLDFKRK